MEKEHEEIMEKKTGFSGLNFKKKTNTAIWVKAFPDQAKKLRPERTEAGGIRARSCSEAVRMAVYLPIAALFKEVHPWCELCQVIKGPGFDSQPTDDVHHLFGRAGLLLFDIRHFKASCRWCHDWVRDNPAKARELGLDNSHKT